MNARQKIKKLKKENNLLFNIVNNADDMRRLYHNYNESVKYITLSSALKQYRVCRSFAVPNEYPESKLNAFMAEKIAEELRPIIENNIHLEDYGDGSALEFKEAKEVKATFSFWIDDKNKEDIKNA